MHPANVLHLCCCMMEPGFRTWENSHWTSFYQSFIASVFCRSGSLDHTLSVLPLRGRRLDIHFFFYKIYTIKSDNGYVKKHLEKCLANNKHTTDFRALYLFSRSCFCVPLPLSTAPLMYNRQCTHLGVRVPQDHCQVWWLARKIQRTQKSCYTHVHGLLWQQNAN